MLETLGADIELSGGADHKLVHLLLLHPICSLHSRRNQSHDHYLRHVGGQGKDVSYEFGYGPTMTHDFWYVLLLLRVRLLGSSLVLLQLYCRP